MFLRNCSLLNRHIYASDVCCWQISSGEGQCSPFSYLLSDAKESQFGIEGGWFIRLPSPSDWPRLFQSLGKYTKTTGDPTYETKRTGALRPRGFLGHSW